METTENATFIVTNNLVYPSKDMIIVMFPLDSQLDTLGAQRVYKQIYVLWLKVLLKERKHNTYKCQLQQHGNISLIFVWF